MAMSNAAGNLEGMDDATAALLLQLQLEDIDEYIGNIREKGKSREGEVSDIELALQLEKEELQRNATILSDREMTKSIARAVVADAPVLGEAARGELDAAADRAIALRLAGGNPLQLPPAQGNHVDEPNDEFIDKLSALYVETPTEDPELSTALVRYDPGVNTGTGITKSTGALVIYNPDVDISNGESSAWAATRPVVNIEKRECVICLDMVVFFEIAKLPCGHECCRGCLQDMFTAAVVDESRYPPRCCDNIATDAKEVRLYLSAELIKAFEEKKVEWESTNRAYCSNEECGLFIRAEHVVPGLATCPTCHTVTCTFCKKSAHDGDCPDDEALQQTLRLMSETGWRRCQQCRAGVELTFGCNHITCKCRAQFCYICGAQWKTCTCPQWDEERLFNRAEQVAGREAIAVDDAAERLRRQANCQHPANRRVREAGHCEDCHQFLPSFLMSCTRCFVRRCRRCVDNH